MLTIISRDDAHAAGKIRFFTGTPCRKGHLSERYVSTGNCLDCMSKFRKRTTTGYTSKLKGWTLSAMIYVPEMIPEQYEALTQYIVIASHHWLSEAGLLDDEMRDALGKLEAFRRRNVGVPHRGKDPKKYHAQPEMTGATPARSAADIRK